VFNHWVTILLTIAAVGGAIATIIGWFRAPIRWWRSRKRKVFCFWSVGKLSDQTEPVTLVSGRWRVTNSSDRDVKITNVRLSNYVHQSFRLAMRNPEDERNIFVYGNFPIAPHQTLEVEVVFTFFPSIGRAPEPIISDVIFTTDNSENQHSVRARFTYGSKSR